MDSKLVEIQSVKDGQSSRSERFPSADNRGDFISPAGSMLSTTTHTSQLHRYERETAAYEHM
jgi:hypothetical protein